MRRLRTALALALPLAATLACGGVQTTWVAPATTVCEGASAGATLRIATFNIRGVDADLERIASALRSIDADVIALQEVIASASHVAGGVDQAAELARSLGMFSAYAPSGPGGDGTIGVAVLSRTPLERADRVELNGLVQSSPRVANDVTVCASATPLRLVNAHADVLPWAAAHNAETLASAVLPSVGSGVIVLGDLNQTPGAWGLEPLANAGLIDVLAVHAEGPTYNGADLWSPRRLDHFWADASTAAAVETAKIVEVDDEVSDHYPVWIDLSVP